METVRWGARLVAKPSGEPTVRRYLRECPKNTKRKPIPLDCEAAYPLLRLRNFLRITNIAKQNNGTGSASKSDTVAFLALAFPAYDLLEADHDRHCGNGLIFAKIGPPERGVAESAVAVAPIDAVGDCCR